MFTKKSVYAVLDNPAIRSQINNQVLDLLATIASNRREDFSGAGLLFYGDLSKLPHLQMSLGPGGLPKSQIRGYDIASIVTSLSRTLTPLHDGFHFIDVQSWKITHISQFISPPIPHDAASKFNGAGARFMSAALASILPGIVCVGLVSRQGKIHLLCNGTDVCNEIE
ncbi:hypothetical protein [Gilvimarinus algae]|uniref:DAC domain-containing protein n=1 Tax=Gilvimarinus algae TaxID=3058037 RepID=A0ABT8TE58_9GAMM|nr:hypothetical protein [Gilvimarinus sp. SDUM040014]MDO3382394.1 hypothetical protein [Gilvimarinus sp. SDUM040014]